MTQDEKEVKKPSNPDYTASAVKLTNAPEVKGLLDEWVVAKELLAEAKATFDKVVVEMPEYKKEVEAEFLVAEARKNLEAAIPEFGGYQDVEQGLYALQQLRKTVTYDPEAVKKHIPDYADKILAQVDTSVLKGLVRGKLITQEQMDACATTKEFLRFVIESLLRA